MKFTPRLSRLRHNTPGWVDNPEYFITLACKPRGLNQLCHPAVAKVIFESILHRQQRRIWQWELIMLMPDHLHGIVLIPDSSDLEESIRNWKRWITSKAGIQFQEGFFDHRLRGMASALEKWQYINENPVRAGLVSGPEKWPYRWTTKDFLAQAASSRPPYLNPQLPKP
jgi:REP element-mobilizing transposase RayT